MQTSMTFIFYLSRMKVYVVEEICNRIDCCRIIDNIVFIVWLWRISGGYSQEM